MRAFHQESFLRIFKYINMKTISEDMSLTMIPGVVVGGIVNKMVRLSSNAPNKAMIVLIQIDLIFSMRLIVFIQSWGR